MASDDQDDTWSPVLIVALVIGFVCIVCAMRFRGEPRQRNSGRDRRRTRHDNDDGDDRRGKEEKVQTDRDAHGKRHRHRHRHHSPALHGEHHRHGDVIITPPLPEDERFTTILLRESSLVEVGVDTATVAEEAAAAVPALPTVVDAADAKSFLHILRKLSRSACRQHGDDLVGWVLHDFHVASIAATDAPLIALQALVRSQADVIFGTEDRILRLQDDMDRQTELLRQRIELQDRAATTNARTYLEASSAVAPQVGTLTRLFNSFTDVIGRCLDARTRSDLPITAIQDLLARIRREVSRELRVLSIKLGDAQLGGLPIAVRLLTPYLDPNYPRYRVEHAGLIALWRAIVGGDELRFNAATVNMLWTQYLLYEGLQVVAVWMLDERFHYPITPDTRSAVELTCEYRFIIDGREQQHVTYTPAFPPSDSNVWVVIDPCMAEHHCLEPVADPVELLRRRHRTRQARRLPAGETTLVAAAAPVHCERSVNGRCDCLPHHGCRVDPGVRIGTVWLVDSPVRGTLNLFEYKNAAVVASKIRVGGFTDWRLPNTRELRDFLNTKLPGESDSDFMRRMRLTVDLARFLPGASVETRFWLNDLLAVINPAVSPTDFIFQIPQLDVLASIFAVRDYRFFK